MKKMNKKEFEKQIERLGIGIKKMKLKIKKPDYKKAFNILMNYWDSLPDDEKLEIDKKLRKCGV